jgi:hypothetical protein
VGSAVVAEPITAGHGVLGRAQIVDAPDNVDNTEITLRPTVTDN